MTDITDLQRVLNESENTGGIDNPNYLNKLNLEEIKANQQIQEAEGIKATTGAIGGQLLFSGAKPYIKKALTKIGTSDEEQEALLEDGDVAKFLNTQIDKGVETIGDKFSNLTSKIKSRLGFGSEEKEPSELEPLELEPDEDEDEPPSMEEALEQIRSRQPEEISSENLPEGAGEVGETVQSAEGGVAQLNKSVEESQAEEAANNVAEDAAENVGEDAAADATEAGLAEATVDSTALDETGIGALVTLGLGAGLLGYSLFHHKHHHHSVKPVVKAVTQPSVVFGVDED